MNPDLYNPIYDCLLFSMTQIQRNDSKFLFIFVGDLNLHHRELLCSVSPANNHSHTAFVFASLLGCEQFVVGATHKSANRLDLVLINVPGIIEVNIFPLIGSLEQS